MLANQPPMLPLIGAARTPSRLDGYLAARRADASRGPWPRGFSSAAGCRPPRYDLIARAAVPSGPGATLGRAACRQP